MISPGGRGADGAATFAGAGTAVGSSGRGRGTVAGVLSVTTTGFIDAREPLNIGAGCEPDCMNSTLIRIATVTNAPTMKPTASRGFQPSMRNTDVARSSPARPLFSRLARVMALRTVVHRDINGHSLH